MKESAFATIERADTSMEAEKTIRVLRNAGLHPAELALTTPLAILGIKCVFPVEVPAEEATAARKVLEKRF
jgi:hypothetical protein